MYKLVFILLILLVTDIISFNYLTIINSDKTAYPFVPGSSNMIFQKKEIVLDDPSDFDFGTYFSMLGFKDTAFKYEFSKDHLIVDMDGKRFLYDYRIKEPQIETVEKVVYKEVTKVAEKENSHTSISVSENEKEGFVYEESYFRLHKESAGFEKGTDISEIILFLKDEADTNMQVTIDYSSLNPNQIGQYTVYFITENGKSPFLVEIY